MEEDAAADGKCLTSEATGAHATIKQPCVFAVNGFDPKFIKRNGIISWFVIFW